MIISTAVEVVVTFEKNHSTTVTITNPGMTSHFGPYLSNKRPVTGDINPFKIPPGKRTRPDANAVRTKPPCRYIGRSSIDDRMTIIQMNTMITPKINIGYLNARRFIIGCFIVSWRIENKIRPTTPTISDTITVGLDHPPEPSPALLNPNTMPPKPIVDRMIDNTSIFGFVVSDTFCIYAIPKTSASTRNGREIQKIQCQLRCSRTNPEKVGPMAGANIMTSPIVPIAAPRL